MNYNFVTDSIEVRGLKENDKPRYIVNGTAILANKPHIYEYIKNKDGTTKTLKNIFTPHCIQSIKEQAKHKSLFIDIQHELVRNASIKALAKDKLNIDEQKQLDNMLKRKMLPLAKLSDIDVDENELKIYTELNPMFREVDDDHKNYFDAVWYSLENKYLNGISPNFGNFKYAFDEHNDMVIDDVEILGFSYVDAAAGHEHSITEVAIRALEEGQNIDEANKMNEEMNKMNEEKKLLENEKIKYLKDKDDFEKEKLRLQTMSEETSKKAEMEKQAAEQEKIQKELQEKTESIKKLTEENSKFQEELNRAKGIVKDIKNPNSSQMQFNPNDPKFYAEKIKEITAKHDATIQTFRAGKTPIIDETFSGFSEMANLSVKAGNFTADLSERDAEYVREHRLLERSGSDLITSRPNRI